MAYFRSYLLLALADTGKGGVVEVELVHISWKNNHLENNRLTNFVSGRTINCSRIR